jgi:hypothetical protein
MVEYTDPSPKQGGFPNPFDRAETFTESNLTLTQSATEISGESVRLPNAVIIDDSEDSDPLTTKNNNWGDWTGQTGMLSNYTQSPLSGSQSLLSKTEGAGDTKAHVERTADITPNVISVEFTVVSTQAFRDGEGARIRFESKSGNEIAEFTADGDNDVPPFNFRLTVGEEYRWRVSNIDYQAETFDQEFIRLSDSTVVAKRNGDNFSQSAAGFGRVTLFSNSFQGGLYSYAVDSLRYGRQSKSGTVTMTWDEPADIHDWDKATYLVSEKNETVDVYVAYNDGSGWERSNNGNPIPRNYSLSDDSEILPSYRVRLEAEISRTNTSNNPKLKAGYRSWKL